MSDPKSLASGRYLLVTPLGEGGMAMVYRAFDQRLQVWRAVKILSAQYAKKPKLKARFESEAQTMALLEHPNICRVYDVGHDGISAYIVMELIESGSLVDWLEANGPMPPRMACEVLLQVCAGIQSAHDKGVIHRDIKPHNVMVTSDGSCRVTDFGIAQVSNKFEDGMTKTGAVMGTWGYMAPEQRTDAKHVDGRADVYALACTLYTLLTDKSPMDLFAADANDPDMAGIDRELVDVILRAAEYRREDRIQSVKDLAEQIRTIIPKLPPTPEGTAPLARPPKATPPIPNPADYPQELAGTTGTGDTIAPRTEAPQPNPTISPQTQWTQGAGFTLPGPASTQEFTTPGQRGGISFGLIFGVLLGILGLGFAPLAVGIVVYAGYNDGF